MTRTIAIALGLLLATSSIAAEKSAQEPAPAPPAAAAASADGAAVCTDDPVAEAEKARKREAALADLGRRLDAEPKVEGEFRVLYRSGHNYDTRSTAKSPAPPAKPAPPNAAPRTDAKPH